MGGGAILIGGMVEKNIKEGKKRKKEEIVSFNKLKMELSQIFQKRHFL
jgi:hypothetical protein